MKCAPGFWGRFPWFVAYFQHPVLMPTSALLNARHPFICNSRNTSHPVTEQNSQITSDLSFGTRTPGNNPDVSLVNCSLFYSDVFECVAHLTKVINKQRLLYKGQKRWPRTQRGRSGQGMCKKLGTQVPNKDNKFHDIT